MFKSFIYLKKNIAPVPLCLEALENPNQTLGDLLIKDAKLLKQFRKRGLIWCVVSFCIL